MILTKNVVDENGQTHFSGEYVVDIAVLVQQRMNWLSEHQIQLRIEKELIQEYILSQQRSSPIKSGILNT